MHSAATNPLSELARRKEQYLAVQLAGNRRAALEFVDSALRAGLSVDDVRVHVVQQAQREIGEMWQEDRISIAQEHMATAISQLALTRLYEHAHRRNPNGKKIVVACVEGELHDLPARLVADALDLAGYDVRYLGADVPTASLLHSVEREKPDLIALSLTMSFHAPALSTAVKLLREQMQSSVPIAVGGNACTWSEDIAGEIGADLTSSNANELVSAVDRMLGVTDD